jgi:hypothetical protein
VLSGGSLVPSRSDTFGGRDEAEVTSARSSLEASYDGECSMTRSDIGDDIEGDVGEMSP